MNNQHGVRGGAVADYNLAASVYGTLPNGIPAVTGTTPTPTPTDTSTPPAAAPSPT
jgi:hypothetical protein